MNSLPVQLRDIVYAYKDNPVLKGITHEFTAGAITAVVGRSGSGKSTLLQVINGLVPVQQGTIQIGDTQLDKSNAEKMRLKMGYVIQHTGLFPHFNIADNISLLGKITGMPKKQMEEKTDELLSISMLAESYKKKYPYQLSGGEQQRAGLCRALFLDPPVLLMDEPFASLDYITKLSLHEYMLNIQQKKARTVIIVTHDFDEAIKIADEFIWIDKGMIREKGPAAHLENIRNSYLKG